MFLFLRQWAELKEFKLFWMSNGVSMRRNNLQVVQRIIKLISIFMMNAFITPKWPVKKLLHDISMLITPPSTFADNPVSGCFIYAAFSSFIPNRFNRISMQEPSLIMFATPSMSLHWNCTANTASVWLFMCHKFSSIRIFLYSLHIFTYVRFFLKIPDIQTVFKAFLREGESWLQHVRTP